MNRGRTATIGRRMARALAALWIFCGLAPQAAGAEYRIAASPDWVVAQALDTAVQPPAGQATQGVHYLLAEHQVRVDGDTKTSFRRLASRALNSRGVSTVAHVSIDFEPSFQTVSLHRLQLHRDGRALDRLRSAQIKVLQREPDLEYRIYDGGKTIDIALDDVREGDIVEYAYSVAGSNPVFGGRAFGRIDTQWSVPVHRMYRRLLLPAQRSFHLRHHLGAAQPVITRVGSHTEYVWTADQVPAVRGEDDMPSWYDAYAHVQWSEFADWAAVARWAEPLYRVPHQVSPALRSEIDRIAAASAQPKERLRAALAFVQSQVRYLGVEIGAGSHAPRSPDVVIARRYGDCKDKTLLAVTMLRALGIDAWPALVSTQERQAIDGFLPSPAAFNHVIVVAAIGSEQFWLDATNASQRGQLDRLAQANFGRALVLDTRSNALTTIPTADASVERRTVDYSIDASEGYAAKVVLSVRTTYEGASADEMRETLRNENLDELQRNYLNFYKRHYAGLEVSAPLQHRDDENANRLVVTETYEMPSIRSDESTPGNTVVHLLAPDIRSLLNRPHDTIRSTPLAFRHPIDVRVNLTASLPQEHRIRAERNMVEDTAFEFTQSQEYEARTLRLHYRLRSLADHVTPQQMDEHIANLAKARKLVGFTLRPDAARGQSSTPSRLLAVGAILVLIVLGTIAAVSTAIRARARRHASPAGTPVATWKLLLVGINATWMLPLGLLAYLAMIQGVNGSLNQIGLGTLLVAVALAGLWHYQWRPEWPAWALQRTSERERLLALARRYGLLFMLHRVDAAVLD